MRRAKDSTGASGTGPIGITSRTGRSLILLSDWANRLRRRYWRRVAGASIRPAWLRIGRQAGHLEGKSIIRFKENVRSIHTIREGRSIMLRRTHSSRSDLTSTYFVMSTARPKNDPFLRQLFKKNVRIELQKHEHIAQKSYRHLIQKSLMPVIERVFDRSRREVGDRFRETRTERFSHAGNDHLAVLEKSPESGNAQMTNGVLRMARLFRFGRELRSFYREQKKTVTLEAARINHRESRLRPALADHSRPTVNGARPIRRASDSSNMVFLPVSRKRSAEAVKSAVRDVSETYSARPEPNRELPVREAFVGELKSAFTKLTDADLGTVADRVMRILDRKESRDHYRRGWV